MKYIVEMIICDSTMERAKQTAKFERFVELVSHILYKQLVTSYTYISIRTSNTHERDSDWHGKLLMLQQPLFQRRHHILEVHHWLPLS